MLPARHRLRSSADFRAAVRRGRRVGGPLLVLHLLEPAGAEAPLRVGLVVSRAVGPAVVRNLVKRRLRHLLRERLCPLPGLLPSSGVLVVRALPSASGASYASLGAELDRHLGRLVAR